MAKKNYVKEESMSYFEYKNRFNNEEACRGHLFSIRWPNGFICPKCDGGGYYFIEKRKLYQCKTCRYQASLTAGTVLDNTRIPIEKWFWAAYLVSTDKRGHSALSLHKELKISYKSAWYLLHRLRTAMLLRDGDYILDGIVEIDEAFFGASDEGGKRGRGSDKTKVIIALSTGEEGSPHNIKMQVVENVDSDTVNNFTDENIEKGSTIRTDGFATYKGLKKEGYNHEPKTFDPKTNGEHLKWLHTVISNAKAFINGTYHGLDKKHLQLYLAEFCFRFNRRFNLKELFNRLMFACTDCEKISYAELTL